MAVQNKEKAVQDIMAIRSTMDRISGASNFKDFIYSMGSMLIIFGVLFIFAIGTTWYLNTYKVPYAGRWIAGIWTILMISGATVKTILFQKRGKEQGFSFNEYLGKVLNGTFFGVDIPIECGGFILIIYFIRIGEPVMILPLLTLITGMLFGNLGHVFSDKNLRTFGYIFLATSAVGFIPGSINYYIYSLFAFGVLFIAWGLILHNKCHALASKAEAKDED